VNAVETVDGRLVTWVPALGWVCAEPDRQRPTQRCGKPVKAGPCPIHHPTEEDPDD